MTALTYDEAREAGVPWFPKPRRPWGDPTPRTGVRHARFCDRAEEPAEHWAGWELCDELAATYGVEPELVYFLVYNLKERARAARVAMSFTPLDPMRYRDRRVRGDFRIRSCEWGVIEALLDRVAGAMNQAVEDMTPAIPDRRSTRHL